MAGLAAIKLRPLSSYGLLQMRAPAGYPSRPRLITLAALAPRARLYADMSPRNYGIHVASMWLSVRRGRAEQAPWPDIPADRQINCGAAGDGYEYEISATTENNNNVQA